MLICWAYVKNAVVMHAWLPTAKKTDKKTSYSSTKYPCHAALSQNFDQTLDLLPRGSLCNNKKPSRVVVLEDR